MWCQNTCTLPVLYHLTSPHPQSNSVKRNDRDSTIYNTPSIHRYFLLSAILPVPEAPLKVPKPQSQPAPPHPESTLPTSDNSLISYSFIFRLEIRLQHKQAQFQSIHRTVRTLTKKLCKLQYLRNIQALERYLTLLILP